MKNLYKYIGGMASILFGLTACYDDKGNYDYHDINEVVVEIPETMIRLDRTGSVELVVEPDLKQTIVQNEDALRYKWYVGSKNAYMICDEPMEECTEDSHFHFYTEDKVFRMSLESSFQGSIALLLEITDMVTDTKYYQKHPIKVVHPFSDTWFVLQSENGKGKLGAVDGIREDAMLFDDIFKSEFNTSFPMEGEPRSIDCRHFYGPDFFMSGPPNMPVTEPMMVMRTNKDLRLVYPTTLEAKYGIEELLIVGAMTDKETNWDTKLYTNSNYGELVYDQGKLWHAMVDGYAVYYRVLDSETKKQMNTPWVAELGFAFIVYDEEKKCFRRFTYEEMDSFNISYYVTGSLRRNPDKFIDYAGEGKKIAYPLESNGEFFDPNDISKDMGENMKMCCMLSNGGRAMAIATLGGQAVTIFEFSNAAEPCTGKYELNLPAPADQCKFIAAHAYDRIFFVAAGNALYKVDLNRQTPILNKIYEHENTAAVIDALKFKEKCVPYGWDTENVMNKYQMQLGLGVNMPDGTGSVVDLVLTSAGDVNRAEGSIYEYPGFGRIVDIAYNYGDE